MGVDNLAITFTGNKTDYTPGEVVSGQVEFQLSGSLDIKEIGIKISGSAHVVWKEGKATYYAKERFFTARVVLHGATGSTSTGKLTIQKGSHFFPFNLKLPSELSSSYKDYIGFIKCYVKVRMVKAVGPDETKTEKITISNKLDLNKLPNIMAPAGASGTKHLCCWCCASGPIEGEVRTDRTGYVPGEWVVANGTVSNFSSSRVKRTSIEVVKRVTYIAHWKVKIDHHNISQEYGPPCDPRKNVSLNNMKLQVPELVAPEAQHCNVLKVEYCIMLMTHLRTCAINLRVCAPITIGAVPLSSQNAGQGVGIAEGAIPATAFGLQPPSTTTGTEGHVISNPANATGYHDWNQSAFTYSS